MKIGLEASPETERFRPDNDLPGNAVPTAHAELQGFSQGLSRRSPLPSREARGS